MQAEHPSLFVQWVGEGAVGKDAVSLLPDNRGPGSCLLHNKGTSLLLVLFTLVLFLGRLRVRVPDRATDENVLRPYNWDMSAISYLGSVRIVYRLKRHSSGALYWGYCSFSIYLFSFFCLDDATQSFTDVWLSLSLRWSGFVLVFFSKALFCQLRKSRCFDAKRSNKLVVKGF